MADKKKDPVAAIPGAEYDSVLNGMVELLETARRQSARAVNAIMTATYWEIGRRIVEVEQAGQGRAEYGQRLLQRLAQDLTARFGRGFSRANIEYMRRFYECWPIPQTLSGKSESTATGRARTGQLPSGQLRGKDDIQRIAAAFPLPWSHYVCLLSVEDEKARQFYAQQALHGGWSVRQLKRQIDSQFYERTLLSKNKAAMLRKGAKPLPDDFGTRCLCESIDLRCRTSNCWPINWRKPNASCSGGVLQRQAIRIQREPKRNHKLQRNGVRGARRRASLNRISNRRR